MELSCVVFARRLRFGTTMLAHGSKTPGQKRQANAIAGLTCGLDKVANESCKLL